MPPARSLDAVTMRAPVPADAEAWVRFLAAQQTITYEGLVPEDFEQHAIEEADAAGLAAWFASPGDDAVVLAEHDGRIVGLASAVAAPAEWEVRHGFVPAPADRELARLYVAPDWHGTGLGAALFDAVIDDRAHYLWLIDGNARAARFYERRGFAHLPDAATTGPGWGNIPMHRMLRPAVPAAEPRD